MTHPELMGRIMAGDIPQRPRYTYSADRMGNVVVRRVSDGADVFLQGDDANQLLEEIAVIETFNYPRGPFNSFEEHLDVLLDQYEPIMDSCWN